DRLYHRPISFYATENLPQRIDSSRPRLRLPRRVRKILSNDRNRNERVSDFAEYNKSSAYHHSVLALLRSSVLEQGYQPSDALIQVFGGSRSNELRPPLTVRDHPLILLFLADRNSTQKDESHTN